MNSFDDALLRIDKALAGVNLAAPSTTKFNDLEQVLADLTNLPRQGVVAVTVRKAGNVRVRALQSDRARAARMLVCVVPEPVEVAGTQRAATRLVQEGVFPVVLILDRDDQGQWRPSWAALTLDEAQNQLADLLHRLGAAVQRKTAENRRNEARREALPDVGTRTPSAPLILDERVRRMLRLAVASHTAVMLVGPPGTGKSQLMAEALTEIGNDPSTYGLTMAHDALPVTPDDSWTTRELVGGDTVDDRGRIRFGPGFVLTAISEDRWLLLDEANRADLDRIFGGLLTWLSGQTVTVGRVSSHPDAGAVRLGWNNEPTSRVVGLEQLTADVPNGDSVEFLAGTEWRMLGTYNALDAQRVFRFGLALGRRFAHVPVPAPSAEGFVRAVTPRLEGLDEPHRSKLLDAMASLYTAHLAIGGATLGPAMFLAIPAYVISGLRADPTADPSELLAESYLTSLGTWLSRLEETQLDELEQTVGLQGPLGLTQWQWVRDQLHAL